MFSFFPYSGQPYSSLFRSIQGTLSATETGQDTFAATGEPVYFWDTSQGKAPSNLFTPLRQTTSIAKKAGIKLGTVKVRVKTVITPVKPPAINAIVETKVVNAFKSGTRKTKIFSNSTVLASTYQSYGKTSHVYVFKPNTVYVAVSPKSELIYSIPNVVTSSAKVVQVKRVNTNNKFGSYKTNITTVQNPTDDELRAIMILMRQQKAKQSASFRKMM